MGFPTESDGAFERTLQAVEEAGISKVHTFPYSPRPGTVAAELGDRVAPVEKKRRSQAMRGRSEALSRHRRTNKLDGSETVLVDKVADSQCSGYTADYTRCYLGPGVARRGELVDVVCPAICTPTGSGARWTDAAFVGRVMTFSGIVGIFHHAPPWTSPPAVGAPPWTSPPAVGAPSWTIPPAVEAPP